MPRYTFPRTFTIEINPLEGQRVGVKCTMLDPYHHIEMNLMLDASDPRAMVIEEASATMERVPYPICREPLERVPQLVGVKIGKGIRHRVTKLLGGPQGCVHLVDMFMEGIRLAIQGVVVIWSEELPPEQGQALKEEMLGGVCIAYPTPLSTNHFPPKEENR